MCSAFFVSPDGYIGTADHCSHGKTITVMYLKNGVWTRQTARVVQRDYDNDSALLKIDEKDMPYFSFDNDARVGDPISAWGWPNVEVYGTNLKHYPGIIYDLDDNELDIYTFIAHGMSGGVVLDNDGKVEGIIVRGMSYIYDKGYSNNGIATRIKFLNVMMLNHGVITLPTEDRDVNLKMVFLVGEE